MIIKTNNLTRSFTMGTQKVHALKGISLEVNRGEFISIMGPSGSGKSTVIQLIERFYAHDSGILTVDGVNIETLDIRKFRQQIGYVGQEPVLFNATIRENM